MLGYEQPNLFETDKFLFDKSGNDPILVTFIPVIPFSFEKPFSASEGMSSYRCALWNVYGAPVTCKGWCWSYDLGRFLSSSRTYNFWRFWMKGKQPLLLKAALKCLLWNHTYHNWKREKKKKLNMNLVQEELGMQILETVHVSQLSKLKKWRNQ